MKKCWRAEVFHLIDRALALTVGGLQVAHYGFWLGALDGDAPVRATEKQYDSMPTYVDAGYNISGLFDWERDCWERFFGGSRSVLVAAAGSGREILALARHGVRADGFDCNGRFVAAGRALLAAR